MPALQKGRITPMRFALDKDGKRVYIEQTHVKQDYFCPECGEKLVLKKVR